MKNVSHNGGAHITAAQASAQYEATMHQWVRVFLKLQERGENVQAVSFSGTFPTDATRCMLAVQKWEHEQEISDAGKLLPVVEIEHENITEAVNAAYGGGSVDLSQHDPDGADYKDLKATQADVRL